MVSLRAVEVCKVAPANNSPDSAATAFSLPLTFLDRIFFKAPPAERVCFFRLTWLTPNFFHSVVLPRLKHSLSQTLLHFLPLDGCLTWPSDSAKPIVLSTPNDVVSLTVAESNANFDLLNNGKILPDLSLELTPSFDRSAIKDPEIPDGLEAFSFNNRVATTPSYSESNPRSLKLPTNVPGVQSKLVRAIFRLSHENIEKLRESILSHCQDQFHPSTFAITYAYVSGCMAKAKGGDFNRKIYCRSRLGSSIPQNYFGNCVFVLEIALEARDFMKENGFAIITEKLSRLIKGLSEKKDFQGAKERYERWKSAEPEAQIFAIAGSPRFAYYDSDFGWGKPEKVEVVSIDMTNAISLIDSKFEMELEIGVALPSHEMEAFTSLFVQGLKDL